MTRASAQETGKYMLGDEQRLEIIVFIIGEVKRPGEYRVADDTDALELLSKAGGPTEFANLGKVSIRRTGSSPYSVAAANRNDTSHRKILKVDLKAYLEEEDAPSPPVLRPGDVVAIPSNRYRTWRTAFAIIRDLSVIATGYFLYLRATDD